MMQELIVSIQEIDQVADAIIKNLDHKKVVVFIGDVGAGKTTLIKALGKALGIQEMISSPTFSLVNEYQGETGVIYHFDFYRLNDEEEALDFGIEEYFYSGNICLLEWAEKIPNLLPSKDECLIVRIEVENNKRKYTF